MSAQVGRWTSTTDEVQGWSSSDASLASHASAAGRSATRYSSASPGLGLIAMPAGEPVGRVGGELLAPEGLAVDTVGEAVAVDGRP